MEQVNDNPIGYEVWGGWTMAPRTRFKSREKAEKEQLRVDAFNKKFPFKPPLSKKN